MSDPKKPSDKKIETMLLSEESNSNESEKNDSLEELSDDHLKGLSKFEVIDVPDEKNYNGIDDEEAKISTIRKGPGDSEIHKVRKRKHADKNHELAMGNTLSLNAESNIVNSDDEKEPSVSTNPMSGVLTGKVFEGKYKVEELLGEGGMGQVYKATHIMMRKEVALKILLPVFGAKLDMIERFRREAESAARLNNPHIISVLDFGRSEEGLFYIVMEYVEGIPLTNHIIEGPMNWKRACRLVSQISVALEAAHEKGIVHRDLKPDNIMVTMGDGGRETVKILDFGIAKLNQNDGDEIKLTRAGMIFGTPSYLSPEQAQGKISSSAVDIYSLGVIFFQMVTGRLPFQGESTIDLINQHINDLPPRPTSIIKNIPEDLELLILECLSKNPKDRPKSAYEIRSAIGNLINETTFKTTMKINMGTKFQDFLFTSVGKFFMLITGILVLTIVLGAIYIWAFPKNGNKNKKTSSEIIPHGSKITKQKNSILFQLIKQGKFDEALKLAEMKVNKNPSDVNAAKILKDVRAAYVGQGLKTASTELAAYTKNNEIDQYIKRLKKWNGWFPRNAKIPYYLAMGYSRIRDHKKAIMSMNKALLLDPKLKKERITTDFIIRYFKSGKQWVRKLNFQLVKEIWGPDKAPKLKFLLKVMNNKSIDADDRYKLFQFMKEHGATAGINQLNLWKSQLLWSTSCKAKREAAIWFMKHGTRKDVKFFKGELKKRKFHVSSGKRISTSCYMKELKKAYRVARRRK